MVRRDPSAADGAPARRGGRWAVGAGASLAAVLALAMAVIWAERRPIATHLIDRTLAAYGVPARYRIEAIGPGRQRLTDVVIGDPAHPDLIADWIETETGLGLNGVAPTPRIVGVRAGRVRARARLADGRLSFGAIDRLLPASGGKRGGLPALALDVADARLRVETPVGTMGVALAGRGRLDGGFEGRAAFTASALAAGGCTLAPPRAVLRVWTRAGQVGSAGPASAASLVCGATRWRAPRVAIDASVDPVAATWRGRWQLAGGALIDPRVRATAVGGGGTVEGGGAAVTGRLTLAASGVSVRGGKAGQVSATGDYAIGAASRFEGDIGLVGASVAPDLRRRSSGLAGTPLAPLAVRAAGAIDAAARSFGGSVRVGIVRQGTATRATIGNAVLTSPTGATLRFEGAAASAGAIDGRLSVAGGRLPSVSATVRRASAEVPLTGVATMLPYAAGGATATLTPLAFSVARSGEARLVTVATLSAPLGGSGRVERLVLPLTVRRSTDGAVLIGERCAPLTFDRVATGGLRLDPARLTLCPVDGALVRVGAGGAVGGGMRLGAVRLGGTLGSSPVAIAADGATIALATRGFVATGVAATLGAADRPTRFAAGSLTGAIAGGGVAGRFADAGGRIGAVPLMLSRAEGTWRVTGAALDLAGALTVSDVDATIAVCAPAAGEPPRFCPMLVRDVSLRLVDGRIVATGVIAEPTTGTRVAAIAIGHDLAGGTGHADLSVERLAFAKGFQPDRLTPITQGVIADVAGTVDGAGHIGWSDAGVVSTGRFATAGLDLAAAFGPVTGIAGSIEFADLLGLASAPGQQVTVASINPGIAVENGTIRFHTEPGVKVAVESARWPFAGGMLTLDPTLLDFSAPAERHMTFRLDGIAADRFLQQFDFKNLAATGTFDGVLPMVFDAQGGRIEQGHLTVREGGGGLAYVGDLTQKELGFWGNFAFQALKSLRYRSLSILMNGALDGEIVTDVRFAGVSQGQGAKSNFLVRRLQRLPFVFNVRIKAPFRTLLDGLDPARQAQLHLRELIDNARRPADPPAIVQPSASRALP